MVDHTVQEGEYAVQIAAKHGFASHHSIWEHPKNAALRQRRNPNVLLPGDVLHIPEKQPPCLSLVTNRRHVITIKRDRLRLRVALEAPLGDRASPVPYCLEANGASQQGKTSVLGYHRAAHRAYHDPRNAAAGHRHS